jgi:hypothetical protein
MASSENERRTRRDAAPPRRFNVHARGIVAVAALKKSEATKET